MNIACVYPETPSWPKFAWVHRALERMGHRVRRVIGRRELAEADAGCDALLFMQKSPGIRVPDVVAAAARRRAVWAEWWFDLLALDAGRPLAEQSYVRTFARLMRAMDLVFVKERGLIGEFHSLGINAAYLDQGCPAEIGRRIGRWPEFDVLVWGQGGADYRQRTADVRALAEAGLRVAWSIRDGRPPPGVTRLGWCPPEELPGLAGRGRCVLSVDRRNDVDGYWSDRFWLAAGMGCCVLRRATPGLPAGPYVIYHDTRELVAAARRLVNDPQAALELGERARAWVLSEHTIEQRCRQLLSAVARVASSARGPASWSSAATAASASTPVSAGGRNT